MTKIECGNEISWCNGNALLSLVWYDFPRTITHQYVTAVLLSRSLSDFPLLSRWASIQKWNEIEIIKQSFNRLSLFLLLAFDDQHALVNHSDVWFDLSLLSDYLAYGVFARIVDDVTATVLVDTLCANIIQMIDFCYSTYKRNFALATANVSLIDFSFVHKQKFSSSDDICVWWIDETILLTF